MLLFSATYTQSATAPKSLDHNYYLLTGRPGLPVSGAISLGAGGSSLGFGSVDGCGVPDGVVVVPLGGIKFDRREFLLWTVKEVVLSRGGKEGLRLHCIF